MKIARINEILEDSLGEVDADEQPREGSKVINLYVTSMALNTAKVRQHAAEMIGLLQDWPSESWGRPVPRLGEEIDYITAGGVLDDQRRALMLFAYGKLLGWWDILDPHTVLSMDYDDPMGRELAGMGMVAITGYRPSSSIAA